MKDFIGRTAVVTGAASGIGKALAQTFAREGMNVVLADIEERALAKTVAEMAEAGHNVVAVPTDVADADSVDALAHTAKASYGAVHLLCNNAGVGLSGGLIWERTLADWEWSFRVNVWGVLHGIRTFLPIMLEQGEEGHVVNTASVAGLTPNILGVYGVTKSAVVSISEYLYRNLVEIDAPVGASVLCPGYVQTDIGGSARNRQPRFKNPRGASRPTDIGFQEELRHRIQNGAAPLAVAEMTLEAVQEGRFWILNDDEAKDLIRRRADGIREGENPGFYGLA